MTDTAQTIPGLLLPKEEQKVLGAAVKPLSIEEIQAAKATAPFHRTAEERALWELRRRDPYAA